MSFWKTVQQHLTPKTGEAQIAAGAAAELWLQDETLNAAIAEMRDTAIKEWSVSDDPEARERAWHTMQAIAGLVSQLRKMVERGHLQQELARREAKGS